MILNGKINQPIDNHVGLQHNFDLSVMQFIALECIPEIEKGGNWDQLFAAGDPLDLSPKGNKSTGAQ